MKREGYITIDVDSKEVVEDSTEEACIHCPNLKEPTNLQCLDDKSTSTYYLDELKPYSVT